MTTLTAKPRPPRAGEMPRNAKTPAVLKTHVVLLALLGLALCVPSLASAEFSRPFITQLTGACEHAGEAPPSCAGFTPFNNSLESLTVDPDPLEDNVFVGGSAGIEGGSHSIVDEFSSSNVFLEQIANVPQHSLAYDDESKELLGASRRDYEYVAVDNTTSPETAGDVYRAAEWEQGSRSGAVRRVNASGSPEPFACTAEHHEEYVKGNELIGKPGETWHSDRDLVDGIAIDSGSGPSAGDIYVINNGGEKGGPQVDVFNSKGCFVREITGAAVPEKGAFSDGGLFGIAVDPSDGDMLVEAYGGSVTEAVYEFTESGGFLGELTGSSRTDQFRTGLTIEGSAGLAVSREGDLYVNVHEITEKEKEKHEAGKYVVDEFGAGAFYPGAVTGEVSGVRSGAVTLNGVARGVANAEGRDLQLAECEFEYVSEKTFVNEGFRSSAVAPCVPGLVGQRLEEKNYPVHAAIEGLRSGEVYRYRLVTATVQGSPEYGGVRDGTAESFAAPAAPVVEGASVAGVSSSWAEFHATIDPRGLDTTYRFEYLSAEQYAANGESWSGADAAVSVPVPAGDAGAGDAGVSVNVPAGGLLADTPYRFRVVAQNAAGTVVGGPGAEGAFATSPASVPGLPDRRVFEMVTPPNKEDSEDLFGAPENNQGLLRRGEGLGGATNDDLGYASEDGGHFLLLTSASFGSFPTTGNDFYVFSRGADGWSFQPGASPSLGVQSIGSAIYDSADFSALGLDDQEGAGGSLRIADLVGPAGGPYAALDNGTVNTPSDAKVVGGSADLSDVVLETEDHELGVEKEDVGQDENRSLALYEWTAARGLRVVNYDPEGKLFKCGAVLGQVGTVVSSGPEGSTDGAVSADGSRVFFTAPDPGEEGILPAGSGCWNGELKNPPELYVRDDGEATVEVSAPQAGVRVAPANPANPVQPAVFVGASKDGSKVFFITRTELTREAEGLRLHDPELYEYDFDAPEGERLTRVSRGQTEAGAPASDVGAVADVPAIAGDGSAVYFNAGTELAPHPGGGGGLYRYDTETGKTSYVAPSTSYPSPESRALVGSTWYASVLGNGGEGEQYASLQLTAPYYATGNGQFLAFDSSANLTSYNSGGKLELYRYRYEPGAPSEGSVVCVSCNPNGSAPAYGATFTRSAMYADNPAGAAPRPISENGQYAFFDTQESLLAQDTNGKVDVYEWHEDPATDRDTLSSISTGQSSSNDFFLDSGSYVNAGGETVEGGNVFFGTHSKLVPADKDEQGDLYDARIEGGFPAPIGAGPCEGDACQPAVSPPVYQTPTSLSFTGPGDAITEIPPPSTSTKTVTKTVKCAKSKKLEHNKCVKQKRSKKAKKSAHKSAKGESQHVQATRTDPLRRLRAGRVCLSGAGRDRWTPVDRDSRVGSDEPRAER